MKTKTLEKLHAYNQERNRLLDELKGFSNEQLNQQPGPEKWSINQVLNHLLIAESGSLQYLQKKLSKLGELGQASWLSNVRVLVLKGFLSSPFSFKAPDVVAAPPHPSDLKTIQQQWSSHDEAMKAFFEGLPDNRFAEETFKHPIFGRMTLFQMIEFFEAHFRRHEGQIRKMM